MNRIIPDVEEENFIDAINDIAEGGKHMSGECRGNLSFWNPGSEYKKMMGALIDIKRENDIFDYKYSFTMGFYEKLGSAFGSNTAYAVVTPSSSYSVVAVLQLLQQGGIHRVGIVAPYYYSVRPVACDLGMDVEIINSCDVQDFQGDALWLTSPVYGTGEYFSQEYKQLLKQLHEKRGIALVFDESLALPGNELCREFPSDPGTIFIYSPHKAISVNAVKFSSVLLYPDVDYDDFVDNRQDMYSGALSNSNIEAANHYLYGNYKSVCIPAYKQFVEERYAQLAAVVKDCSFAHLAPGHSGHYHTIFTDIPLPSMEEYIAMLERLNHDTGFIFYPTDVNDFHRNNSKLTFRVNILTDANLFLEGTKQVLDWLQNNY